MPEPRAPASKRRVALAAAFVALLGLAGAGALRLFAPSRLGGAQSHAPMPPRKLDGVAPLTDPAVGCFIRANELLAELVDQPRLPPGWADKIEGSRDCIPPTEAQGAGPTARAALGRVYDRLAAAPDLSAMTAAEREAWVNETLAQSKAGSLAYAQAVTTVRRDEAVGAMRAVIAK